MFSALLLNDEVGAGAGRTATTSRFPYGVDVEAVLTSVPSMKILTVRLSPDPSFLLTDAVTKPLFWRIW
jgi:hypothetical protein